MFKSRLFCHEMTRDYYFRYSILFRVGVFVRVVRFVNLFNNPLPLSLKGIYYCFTWNINNYSLNYRLNTKKTLLNRNTSYNDNHSHQRCKVVTFRCTCTKYTPWIRIIINYHTVSTVSYTVVENSYHLVKNVGRIRG